MALPSVLVLLKIKCLLLPRNKSEKYYRHLYPLRLNMYTHIIVFECRFMYCFKAISIEGWSTSVALHSLISYSNKKNMFFSSGSYPFPFLILHNLSESNPTRPCLVILYIHTKLYIYVLTYTYEIIPPSS